MLVPRFDWFGTWKTVIQIHLIRLNLSSPYLRFVMPTLFSIGQFEKFALSYPLANGCQLRCCTQKAVKVRKAGCVLDLVRSGIKAAFRGSCCNRRLHRELELLERLQQPDGSNQLAGRVLSRLVL